MNRILPLVVLGLLAFPLRAELIEKPWPAPDFSLADQNAEPVRSADLRGRVYIVDFIFTTCAGPCPMMTQKLVELAAQVKDPEIRFVSITVDPKRDTPVVLKAYAKERGATDPRIRFATGPEDEIVRICRSLLLGIQKGDERHQIIHSDRFMVIDRAGVVRGTYRPLDPDSFKQLLTDLALISAPEPTPLMKRFPAVNASLNALAGIFLLLGYAMIRNGRWRAHAVCMISAIVCSVAFLACYLTYHYLKTKQGVLITKFPEHWLRPIYLVILLTHTVLAAAVVPMVVMVVTRAARRQWDRHVRVARPTFAIWLYVSATGVMVYWMLYHLAPGL